MNKKILFFDTETTGFPNSGPLQWQPYIVQIAWMVWEYSDDFTMISKEETFDLLFRPDGNISPEVSKIHWITDEMVKDRPMMHQDKFIIEFIKMMDLADIICCHNTDFDFNLICIQIDRLMERFPEKKSGDFKKRCIDKLFCTMKSSTTYCKLPWRMGDYKWPKLMELHTKLFWVGFDSAHNAINDIMATKACFFELIKLKIISL